ncbi:MAG: hypothetical protein ACRDBO_19770 [Lachnospiraceae bacterium]
MNRIQALEEAALALEHDLFASQCSRLEQEYQKKERRKEVTECFASLFGQAAEIGKEVSWLGVCYLHSSLKTGSHELLVSLYGKEFIMDTSPLQLYWHPSCFFECFEEDMKGILKQLQNRYHRIWKFEEEFIRRVCVEYYYAAISQLCKDLEQEITETRAFQEMNKSNMFSLFFGRYQGEGDILWHINTR